MSIRAEIAWARRKHRLYDLAQMLYVRHMQASMARYLAASRRFRKFKRRDQI